MGRGTALFVVFLGIVAIGFGIYMRPTVPEGWRTVDGTVVGLQAQQSAEDVVYSSTVEYMDQAGGVHRVTSAFPYSGPGADKVGDHVQVAFNPQSPDQARVNGGVSSWLWLGPLGFGAIFVVIGVFRLLRAR